MAGKKFLGVRIENLHVGLTEENIFEFFTLSEIAVEKVKILADEISGASKGVAFAKFENHEHAVHALQTSGTIILGQAILVYADDTLLLS